jgi:hypothetical protein
MKRISHLLVVLLAVLSACAQLGAQASLSSSPVVPRLVNFSGKATDSQGKTVTGVVGATFAIYKDQFEGASLWIETQNVQADSKGNYTVQLGATKPEGLPLDLFTSGEARWLGVTVNGGQEQPRVLLLSVPYALKAADAETVGGLPASAFVLAAPISLNNGPAVGSTIQNNVQPSAPPPASNVTTSGGTVNALPLWTTSTNIQSSAIAQTGSGATSKVGINTTAPASTLDVNGAATVRGNLQSPCHGIGHEDGGEKLAAYHVHGFGIQQRHWHGGIAEFPPSSRTTGKQHQLHERIVERTLRLRLQHSCRDWPEDRQQRPNHLRLRTAISRHGHGDQRRPERSQL